MAKNTRDMTWSSGKVRLPNPRVSAYPRAPGRLMGPGPSVGKAGATPPEDAIFFGPISALAYYGFQEVYRGVVKGFAHGKLIVSADVVMSAATTSNNAPQLYVDVQIVGYTNGVPEVLAYGATGMRKTATDQAYALADNVNLDAPPVQTEWDDSFGFDEVAVSLRTMGNGGQAAGPLSGFAANAGDILNVSIAGKLWR